MRTSFLSTAFIFLGAATLFANDLVGQAKVDALMLRRERPIRGGDVEALNAEIDRAANAKYAHLSGLYWHTDLAEAKRTASAENKPILSLRMLGRLDEELSCANSRFFRLLLYPDAKIAKLLHDRFVLHWQSVRPVPIITIDLGNGRTIRRTITGNSIHYVLLPTGEVMDGLPGLFAQEAFRHALESAADGCREILAASPRARERSLLAYQTRIVNDIEGKWRKDLASWSSAENDGRSAELACGECPRERSAEIFWRELGASRPEYSRLSNEAESLVRREYANIRSANGVSDIEIFLELNAVKGSDPVTVPMVRELLPRMAADTVHGEYRLRRDLHELLATFPAYRNVDMLNADVYRRLFRAPLDDPWLGLARPDIFTGLPEDGGLKAEGLTRWR